VSTRWRLLFVVLAVAVLAAAIVSRAATRNAHADVLAVLQGSVGPDFTISLKNPDGSLVSSLAAGDYEIQVNDQASNHNFHLEGPGVNVATGLPDVQTADWMVTLGDGYYTYHCDQHASLTASFAAGNAPVIPVPAPAPVAAPAPVTITSAPPSSSSSSSSSGSSLAPVVAAPAADPFRGTLTVVLGPKSTLTITKGGKAVTKLTQGTYKLVISDGSTKQDVSVAQTAGGSYRQALTSAAFHGTKTVSVDLTAGQWKVYSAARAGIFSFFTVSK
jgi:hypothetical protein